MIFVLRSFALDWLESSILNHLLLVMFFCYVLRVPVFFQLCLFWFYFCLDCFVKFPAALSVATIARWVACFSLLSNNRKCSNFCFFSDACAFVFFAFKIKKSSAPSLSVCSLSDPLSWLPRAASPTSLLSALLRAPPTQSSDAIDYSWLDLFSIFLFFFGFLLPKKTFLFYRRSFLSLVFWTKVVTFWPSKV